MTSRSCPVCASSDRSFIFAESNVDVEGLDAFAFASRKLPEYMHWRLLECKRCDVIYASPAPAPRSLTAAYRTAAFDTGVEARYAARTYGRLLQTIVRQLPDLGGALDIGTGDGAFLAELLNAGFTSVEGVEPSTAPLQSAVPRVRPLIRHADFRVSDFSPESFRLITCFQTVEHLHDPMAMCRDSYRLLKPGGAVLLVAHNRRALSARLLGRRSPIFDIEHLQLFSPTSLRRLVTGAGFVDVRVGSLVNRYPLSYWAKLLPFPRSLKERLTNLMNFGGVAHIAVPLPAGNSYVMAFKRSL